MVTRQRRGGKPGEITALPSALPAAGPGALSAVSWQGGERWHWGAAPPDKKKGERMMCGIFKHILCNHIKRGAGREGRMEV